MDAQTGQSFVATELGLADFSLTPDPLASLDTLLRAFMHTLPFQNLTLWSLGLAHQPRIPSPQESVHLGLSRQGGICFSQNYFLKTLLTSLGVRCWLGVATVKQPNDHAIVLVRDLVTPGDVYVADCGFGTPAFSAVCLDLHDGGFSQEYAQSFQTYRYTKQGDTYTRQHRLKGEQAPAGFTVVENQVNMYTFTLDDPGEQAILRDINTQSYSNPDSMFNNAINMVVWRGGRAVAIKNNMLMEEDEAGEWVKTPLDTGNHIVQAACTHFPTIPRAAVLLCVTDPDLVSHLWWCCLFSYV